ncbi:hypothetical protein [Runella sp.]|uniref:hypothetical protein n=1 Tax=Runella sp. TaxID=1960881 RepID=UPI003D0EBC21
MTIETYKEIFIECLETFDFVRPYLDMDAEYKNRDYSNLVKEKIAIGDVKKKLKEVFPKYSISNQHGGIYLRQKINNLFVSFFFKFNGNIFQPYYNIYLEEEKFENSINQNSSGSAICRYLLKDNEYPMKAKIFSNVLELVHLIKNEVLFFEKFTLEYIKKVSEKEV